MLHEELKLFVFGEFQLWLRYMLVIPVRWAVWLVTHFKRGWMTLGEDNQKRPPTIVDIVNYFTNFAPMNQKQIDKIRCFNRKYTKVLGILNKHYMGSPFGLPEIRVIQDIYLHPNRSANEISEELNMDKGYMSRLLKNLERQNYICRSICKEDARRGIISLTESGISIYHELDNSANQSVNDIYGHLSEAQITSLISHMEEICKLVCSPTSNSQESDD